jgi:hypothetical protein
MFEPVTTAPRPGTRSIENKWIYERFVRRSMGFYQQVYAVKLRLSGRAGSGIPGIEGI